MLCATGGSRCCAALDVVVALSNPGAALCAAMQRRVLCSAICCGNVVCAVMQCHVLLFEAAQCCALLRSVVRGLAVLCSAAQCYGRMLKLESACRCPGARAGNQEHDVELVVAPWSSSVRVGARERTLDSWAQIGARGRTLAALLLRAALLSPLPA